MNDLHACPEIVIAGAICFFAGALVAGLAAWIWHEVAAMFAERERRRHPKMAEDCLECPFVGARARASRLNDPMQPVDFIRP